LYCLVEEGKRQDGMPRTRISSAFAQQGMNTEANDAMNHRATIAPCITAQLSRNYRAMPCDTFSDSVEPTKMMEEP